VQGSFAGAMGLPQFMPSSLNTWAVDFDGDGRIDLAGSAADAIGSVAHYLNYFGWRRGTPTHFDVRPPDDEASRALLLGPDILPLFSAEEFTERGATEPHRRHAQLLGGDALQLVELLRAGGDRAGQRGRRTRQRPQRRSLAQTTSARNHSGSGADFCALKSVHTVLLPPSA
jgi:membrane-bound lytic murein transglycosylase B